MRGIGWRVAGGVLALGLLGAGCGPEGVNPLEPNSATAGVTDASPTPALAEAEHAENASEPQEGAGDLGNDGWGQDPPAAEYLGVGRWSCEEVADAVDGLLRPLGETDERTAESRCFVLNGAGGDMFAPPSDPQGGPWQVGVLYTPAGISEEDLSKMSLDDVLSAGGVVLSVDFNAAEPPPDNAVNTNDGLEAEGEPAVLHETTTRGHALGVWFAGEEGRRVRGTLIAVRSREEMTELMAAVEVGIPR